MKLKYYLSWIVLTMFLLSSFAVFGEENTAGLDSNTVATTDTKTETNAEKTTTRDRENIRDRREDIRDKREDVRDKREDIRDKLDIDRERCIKKCVEESGEGAKIRCEAKCKVADVREDIRDKREDIRDRLKNLGAVKERLKLAEAKLKAEKVKFIEARDRFKKECASIANADNGSCRSIKAAIKSNAKPHLLNTVNAVLESLNKLKAKVDASDYLEENDKKEILANVDAKITKANELIAMVEALNENSTPEEVKQLAQEIRAAWKEIKPLLEAQHKRLGIVKMGGIIKKSEKLEKKLNKVLEKMKVKGFDVTNLDTLIVDFNNHLKLAKASHIGALKLISANDVKGAHAKLTDAKEHLKLAHETFKKIVQEIKNRDKIILETSEPEETQVTEIAEQAAATS